MISAQVGDYVGAKGRGGNWGFISGRISVLEGMLLGRAFFESLITARNAAEARATMGKTLYRESLNSDESIERYGEALDSWRSNWRRDLLKQCPWHPCKAFWELTDSYATLRTAVMRKTARGPVGEDFVDTLSAMAAAREELPVLREHIAEAHWKGIPVDATSVSMMLDSACCSAMWSIAAMSREPRAAAVMRDRAAMQTWSSVLRARWNGTPAEIIKEWFVVVGEGEGLVDATLASGDGEPAAALSGFASTSTELELRAMPAETIRADLEKCMSEAAREAVIECRREAFGPERVVAFLAALDVEEANLRISLAAVVDNLDRSKALSRLRREYA